MDRRRGLTRLAIVLGVPYFGGWAVAAYLAYRAFPRYLRFSREAASAQRWEESTEWMKRANEAGDVVTNAMLWGVVYPLVAAIVAALGFWVYRGFRPKS